MEDAKGEKKAAAGTAVVAALRDMVELVDYWLLRGSHDRSNVMWALEKARQALELAEALEPAPPLPVFEPRTSEPIMPCKSGPVIDSYAEPAPSYYDPGLHKPGTTVDPSKYPEHIQRLFLDQDEEARRERNAEKRRRKAIREARKAKRAARKANRR